MILSAVLGLQLVCLAVPAVSEDDTTNAGDNFFAGTVTSFSSAKVTVARTVRNETESRSFKLTPQTKFEGKLSNNVRVTVRYVTDDEGDTATMVIVRPAVPPQKK